MTRTLLFLIGICLGAAACAADPTGIAIPKFQDKYSDFVRQLESGKTDIDYRAFRESFLESSQFAAAGSRREELDHLRDRFPELIRKSDYAGIVRTAQQMLSIDYTSMLAHKMLQQTYKILGDEANRQKYHDIEFGLLKSIVQHGDGKSCRTAWPVVQVDEEYFILNVMGAELRRQSVVNDGGLCDRMDVVTDKGPAVFYFDVARVFEQYDKLLGH